MRSAIHSAKPGQAGRVEIIDNPFGGQAYELTAPASRAVVALRGAQVLSWQPNGMDEVLWLAPKTRHATGKPVRGGVPICWPWFGAHPTGAAMPAHGLARTAKFSVLSAHASDCETTLKLGLEIDAQNGDFGTLWPHSARLVVTIKTGDQLVISLETTNNGAEPFLLSQALHSYLRVSDISDVHVQGLDGCSFLDSLSGRADMTIGDIAFDGELDRIYTTQGQPVSLADGSLGRRVVIASSGSRSTVVWNPWIEKSKRLSDMEPEDYRRMLCIETANAASDVRTLLPGGVHTLSTRIAVERL